MKILGCSLLCGAMCLLSACAEPTKPVGPPADATGEEKVQFYSDLCTKEGIPKRTIEEAIAAGDTSPPNAHELCIANKAIEYLNSQQT